MLNTTKVVLWSASKWGDDKESAQDDDIESKDFKGESGKEGFAENNGQMLKYRHFLNSEGSAGCFL